LKLARFHSMKKLFFLIIYSISISLVAQNSFKRNHDINRADAISKNYAKTITQKDLKKLVYKLADDKFEGRKTGENGQKLAAKYLVNYYKKAGIKATNKEGNYLQNIPKEYFRGRSINDSENVIAYIKGSEKPDEYIIISAHYDHIGFLGEEIYSGADDDASGTSAVLEIAEAFHKAVKDGFGPKRSLVFLNVTGT